MNEIRRRNAVCGLMSLGDLYSSDGIRFFATQFPEHLESALSTKTEPISCNGRVCMFGVGNSAMAGDIMQAYLDENSEYSVPMISDDRIPGWIGENDHTILISYSGESREILSCYKALKERGCIMHCIVGGGTLRENAVRDGVDIRVLPQGVPSRAALGYTLGYLADLIQALGISDIADYLLNHIDYFKEYIANVLGSEKIEDIAHSMVGKIPAIYTTTDMLPIAKRWRADLYQNCGMIAFYGEMPEFDHNEIVGWADPNIHVSELEMFILRSNDEPEIIKIIVDAMTETLNAFERETHTISITPSESIIRNICGCLAGDILSARLKELV